LRFGLGREKMSQVKMGERFGVPRERIGRLVAKAIKNLQHESRSRRIKPLFYTYEEMRDEINKRDDRICELTSALREAKLENTDLRKRNKQLEARPIESLVCSDIQLSEVLDLEIEEVDLSYNAYICLKRHGLDTIRDIVLKYNSYGGLLKIRNFGKRSLQDVEAKLLELGVPLGHPDEYYL